MCVFDSCGRDKMMNFYELYGSNKFTRNDKGMNLSTFFVMCHMSLGISNQLDWTKIQDGNFIFIRQPYQRYKHNLCAMFDFGNVNIYIHLDWNCLWAKIASTFPPFPHSPVNLSKFELCITLVELIGSNVLLDKSNGSEWFVSITFTLQIFISYALVQTDATQNIRYIRSNET